MCVRVWAVKSTKGTNGTKCTRATEKSKSHKQPQNTKYSTGTKGTKGTKYARQSPSLVADADGTLHLRFQANKAQGDGLKDGSSVDALITAFIIVSPDRYEFELQTANFGAMSCRALTSVAFQDWTRLLAELEQAKKKRGSIIGRLSRRSSKAA